MIYLGQQIEGRQVALQTCVFPEELTQGRGVPELYCLWQDARQLHSAKWRMGTVIDQAAFLAALEETTWKAELDALAVRMARDPGDRRSGVEAAVPGGALNTRRPYAVEAYRITERCFRQALAAIPQQPEAAP